MLQWFDKSMTLLLTMTHSRKMSPLGMPSSEAAATYRGAWQERKQYYELPSHRAA
jgi:hypothetical protein